jgi:CarD family transcriptional regulator
MQFKIGDDAVHPSYGVGQIVRLEERQLAEAELRLYYVLAIGKHTVFVPIDADGSSGLRAVISQKELEQCRAVLKSRPAGFERDRNKRRLEIHERLIPGSFRRMCEAVRDLTALGWYRRIGEGDAAILQKVRDNVWREWAVAAHVSLSDAIQEVDALLQAGREVYKA